MAKRSESYLGKSLHGYYEHFCRTVRDDILSFNWLTKSDLSIESEGFLCAAQEQALSTRAMMQVYSQGSSMCRLFGEHPETVEHLISGCSQLAGQQYKSRHDPVARYIHWLLCQKYNVECGTLWWQHTPMSVIENNLVKILWDFNIYCDRIINARRPDITIIDKTVKLITLVDISVKQTKELLRKRIRRCPSTRT